MKKIVFAFMLLLANVAIAQPSVFHGVSFRTAELNEEIKDEYIWNDIIPMDFPVIMHADTIVLDFPKPYASKTFVNSSYKLIDSKTEGWKSIDEMSRNCWVYLIDEDDATYVRIEYNDHAYLIEIQLYD